MVTKLAKKKHRGGRGKKAAISVAMAAPLVIAGYPAMKTLVSGDVTGAATQFKDTFASPAGLASIGVSFAMGYIMHRVAGKVGINRMAKKLTMGYLEV